jgi:tight adherence protein B
MLNAMFDFDSMTIALLLIAVSGVLIFVTMAVVLPAYSQRYQAQFNQLVGERLNAAFVFFDPSRVLSVQLVVTVLVVVAVGLLTRSILLMGISALIVGFIPSILLYRLKIRRGKMLRLQLPDAMMIVSSSLRSGHSLSIAIGAVASEMPAPISQEFELMLRECRLGMTMDQALARIEQRNPFEEFKLLGAAIRISTQTGGNLAESLEMLASSLRTKLAIEGKLDALTSQGRMQAWVVGGLPFAVAFILFEIDRPGMLPLLTTTKGWIACGTVLVLQFFGVLVIRKIVRIEV